MVFLQRRRTQIRLAQRTYRARKESTITFLEDKVARLESQLTSSNARYRDFYHLALRDNLANTHPALFDVLTKLTQDVKTPSDYGQNEPRSAGYDDPSRTFVAESDSSSGSENHDHHHLSTATQAPPLSAENSIEEILPTSRTIGPGMATAPANGSSASASGMPTVWGYEAVYEPSENPPQAVVQYGYPPYMHQGAPPQIFGPIQQQQQPPPPFQMGQPLMRQPVPHQFRQSTVPQELELPRTNAYQESSFSRFFHRRCLEYAFTLLANPQQHQSRIDKVFAHALQHSAQGDIYKRMKSRMHRSVDQDLEASVVYQLPPDVDQSGRWLKPRDIEQYLRNKGMDVHPRAHTLEYVTEDNSQPTEGEMIWNHSQDIQPSAAVPNGQMLLAPPTAYQNMQGMYVDQMGQQYPTSGSWTQATPAVRRKKIVLDVSRLVDRLMNASKCRGRTPAVLQQDVEHALHRSVLSVEAC